MVGEEKKGEYQSNKKEGKKRTLQFSMLVSVEAFLTQGNHLAKQNEGVWHPHWVTQQEVEDPSDEQRQ